ncbi:MAG: hypothetical protein ACJ79I_03535 [Gemmatimonadaceae bacterium]
MTDDRFEEFLKTAAQGYNAPPVRVPRDEMWNAIQAKRAAGPRVVYGGGVAYISSHRRFGARVWLGAAAAAMLLVATGVGIGRWTATPNEPAVATTLPTTPVVVTPEASSGLESGLAVGQAVSPLGSRSRNVTEPRVGEGNRAVANNTVAPNSSAPNSSNVGSGNSSPTSTSSAYQLTAVRHLSEAEALLTSFRTRSNADQQMDAQLGVWARQLLSNTRLLLDSPVANDPQRRPLLEDLELVLVQIVQLSPGSTPQDRELIEKSLQQDHVMTRLRTAIPAGSQRGS